MNCIDCGKTKISVVGIRCRSCVVKHYWSRQPTTKLERICRTCNKKFTIPRSQAKQGSGFYCGRKCFWEYFHEHYKPALGKTWKHTKEYKKKLSDARKGSNNPMYVHGMYSGIKRRGKTQRQKLWRKKVYKRDNWTCQMCEKRGGIELNAHHIKLWAYFPKDRYKISNGITLCQKCHKIVHDKKNKENSINRKIKKISRQKIAGLF